MKFFHIRLCSLALSALILAGCASDGSESVEEVEDENRIHQPADETNESETLPSAEQASIEAAEASSDGDAVDSNFNGEVQQLPSEQQLAGDTTVPGAEEPDQYQLKQASVEGAQTATPETASLPSLESPSEVENGSASPAANPEAAAAVGAETDSAEPAAMAEASPEVAPSESIPTLADIVTDSEAVAPAADKPSKKSKKKKSRKSQESSENAAPVDSGDGKLYVVQPGDTLGSISSTLYGSSRRWKEIADKNGLSGSFRIFPGDSLRYNADASTAAFESKWDGLNKASVEVAKNETLSSIAARVMGNPAYWKVLWQWNQTSVSDPHKIAVGQSLQYIKPEDLSAALSKSNDAQPAH